MKKQCVFCELPQDRLIFDSTHWLMISDGYPVSEGHILIIPKRHIKDFFELNAEEYIELQAVINLAKINIEKEYQPDGYNIGINCGEAAGQTVFHLHVHLIPRYTGDMEDPRGGVRGVIPDKQKY